MLPRDLRLRRAADVDRVFRRGASVSVGMLLAKSLPNQQETPRVAVLVGKKLAKKAVHRNRIKRRLRELVRLHFAAVPAGVDLLIIARDPKLAVRDFRELSTEMLTLLHKVNRLVS